MRYADSSCKCTESFSPEHTYTFTGPCLVTGEQYSVVVKAPELFAYRQGKLIQNALRSVSRDDREFLMSGYSPAGFNQLFGGEDNV